MEGKKEIKMVVFRTVAPFSVVEVYRHSRGAYCLHHQGHGRHGDRGIFMNTRVRFYETADLHTRAQLTSLADASSTPLNLWGQTLFALTYTPMCTIKSLLTQTVRQLVSVTELNQKSVCHKLVIKCQEPQ
jgi:hypothetical protein